MSIIANAILIGQNKISSGGGPVYDSDYQAILDRGTTLGYTLPSLSQRALQNTLLAALKTSGDWANLQVLYITATDGSSDFATLNWKAPTLHQLTKINTPVFTTNIGFSSGASSLGYLSMNWVPSTSGGVYTQNSASFGVYNFTALADFAATGAGIGAISGTSNILINDGPAANVAGRINSSNVNTSFGAIATFLSRTLYSMFRTGAAALSTFRNATLGNNGTTASTALVSVTPFILARNNAGAKDFPAPPEMQISAVYAGSSSLVLATFVTDLETYITAINP
jgi:hypothetical protein